MVSIKQRLTVLAVAAFEVNEIPQGGLEDLLSLQVALQTFFYSPFHPKKDEKSGVFLLQKVLPSSPPP